MVILNASLAGMKAEPPTAFTGSSAAGARVVPDTARLAMDMVREATIVPGPISGATNDVSAPTLEPFHPVGPLVVPGRLPRIDLLTLGFLKPCFLPKLSLVMCMVKHDDYMTPFSAWKDVSAYIPRHLTLWEASTGTARLVPTWPLSLSMSPTTRTSTSSHTTSASAW